MGRPAHARTWAFGTLSLQLMPRMYQRLRKWKLFIFCSCLAYVVHALLPYRSVLMIQVLYTASFVATVILPDVACESAKCSCSLPDALVVEG